MKKRGGGNKPQHPSHTSEGVALKDASATQATLEAHLDSSEKYHRNFNFRRLFLWAIKSFFLILIFLYDPAKGWYVTNAQAANSSEARVLLLMEAIITTILTAATIAAATMAFSYWVLFGGDGVSKAKAYLQMIRPLLRWPAELKKITAEAKYDLDWGFNFSQDLVALTVGRC
jgi:hypothetical protein